MFTCNGRFIASEFTSNKVLAIIGRLSQGHPNNKDIMEAEKFIEKLESSF